MENTLVKIIGEIFWNLGLGLLPVEIVSWGDNDSKEFTVNGSLDRGFGCGDGYYLSVRKNTTLCDKIYKISDGTVYSTSDENWDVEIEYYLNTKLNVLHESTYHPEEETMVNLVIFTIDGDKVPSINLEPYGYLYQAIKKEAQNSIESMYRQSINSPYDCTGQWCTSYYELTEITNYGDDIRKFIIEHTLSLDI